MRRFSEKSPLRLLLKLAAAALACMALWTAYVQWLIHTADNKDMREKRDAAIVLGAALWNDVPSPALRERLDHAYELYKGGYVPKLIVSGGLDSNGATVTEAEGMKTYLAAKGVPEHDIVLEDRSRSTYENLLFSRSIMERNGWERAVIVTHTYHAARALDIARFLGYKDPVVSATDSKVMWMPWHKGRETLAYAKWQLDKLLLLAGWKEKEAAS